MVKNWQDKNTAPLPVLCLMNRVNNPFGKITTWPGVILKIVNYVGLTLAGLILSACSSAPLRQHSFSTQLQQAGLTADEISLVMQPLFQGNSGFYHRADAAMAPASTMKLLTSTVALATLGPDWRGSSRFLLAQTDYIALQQQELQPQPSFTLRQPLYLQAGADADFNYAELSALLSQVRALGVTTLGAGIVLDRSSFLPGRNDIGQADFDEAPKARYNHRPDALYLGQSQQVLRLVSDHKNARATLFPYWPDVKLDLSELQLTQHNCEQAKLSQLTSEFVAEQQYWRLKLKGSFPQNCQQQQSFELIDRDAALLLSLAQEWQRLGGQIHTETAVPTELHKAAHRSAHCCHLPIQHKSSAAVLLPSVPNTNWLQTAVTPPDAVPVATHLSRPLGELVLRVNKSSDNALTRLLYLTLGAEHAASLRTTNVLANQHQLSPDGSGLIPGKAPELTPTAQMAEQKIRHWLTQQGINQQQLVLDNGSGLSRSERISALFLTQLLSHVWQADYGPELIASLPLAGIDGTLKNRFRQGAAYKKARLKTGTLKDVTALAGYVYDGRHRPWIFVAVVNSPKAATAGKTLLNQLVEQLAQYQQ